MKGLALARSLFHDPLLSEWVDVRRNRFATQLEFVDTISHRYMYVMTALPSQLSAIMHHILCSYFSGIQPKEIARSMFKPQTSISNGLMLLRRAGLVIVEPGNNARERKYFVDDRDFLLVNAIRWDPRFPSFLEANRDRMAECVVDAFIAHIGGGVVCKQKKQPIDDLKGRVRATVKETFKERRLHRAIRLYLDMLARQEREYYEAIQKGAVRIELNPEVELTGEVSWECSCHYGLAGVLGTPHSYFHTVRIVLNFEHTIWTCPECGKVWAFRIQQPEEVE